MADPLSAEANLLGALALVLTDQMAAAGAAEAGESGAAAAALTSLHQFLDRPTLDTLRRVLGLTHSGAVRLVNRLEAEGLVTRAPGADGRSRAVTLTPAGRQAATRVAAARAAVLERALRGLPPDSRATLHELLGPVLAAIVQGKDGGAWICRLCDLPACGRDQGRCPTANAAAARFGVDQTGAS
ncbi:MarR family transcriptional regulator [Actinoplanes sp. NPDC024001]|uniref:MarR family winged helix-turn-helix transcriptional regulator n=1 Tax=Actinoplanes sp. NPDC024001 TaxID=3154598 RepID=UPI0033FBAF9B